MIRFCFAASYAASFWLAPFRSRRPQRGFGRAFSAARVAGCDTWLEGNAWRLNPFCSTCRRQIKVPQLPLCTRCGAATVSPVPYCSECDDLTWPSALKMVRAAGLYEGPLRDGIHLFKYRGQWSLAEGLGAQLHAWGMAQPSGIEPLPLAKIALIVPIPMHPWRQWRRGYNQSALLAAQLSRHLAVPNAELLRRTRYTPPQVSMDGDARRSNMGGVFALRPSERAKWQSTLAQQPILLLDDVFTTGTTLRACARTLQNAGAGEVYALALARAGDPNPRP